MKKQKCVTFLYLVSIILVVGFLVSVCVDYFTYDSTYNSAPFYVFIIVRGIEFILPVLPILIVATILKKKKNKE
ncbi:MAG: hypothetical protein ACLU84_03075 [Clostridia bacterium]